MNRTVHRFTWESAGGEHIQIDWHRFRNGELLGPTFKAHYKATRDDFPGVELFDSAATALITWGKDFVRREEARLWPLLGVSDIALTMVHVQWYRWQESYDDVAPSCGLWVQYQRIGGDGQIMPAHFDGQLLYELRTPRETHQVSRGSVNNGKRIMSQSESQGAAKTIMDMLRQVQRLADKLDDRWEGL